jgi:hypothetical protein
VKFAGKCKHVVIVYGIGMTANTVLLYNLLSCLQNKNNLGFAPQRKYCGVAQAIFGLEIIFVNNIIMRHMTIVAIGDFPMSAVVPCGKLGSHDMAIDTGFGFIG